MGGGARLLENAGSFAMCFSYVFATATRLAVFSFGGYGFVANAGVFLNVSD